MPLTKTIVSLPYAGGLDEKKSSKHKSLGKLDECLNGVFEKSGQIRKRAGFTRLSNADANASTITTGKATGSYKGEALVFDGNTGYSLSDSGTWVDRGRVVGSTFHDEVLIPSKGLTSTPAQIAVANGYRVESWAETDPEAAGATFIWRVYSRVMDVETGSEVVPRTEISPQGGLTVTKSHVLNNESAYYNPQVQVAEIAGYIWTFFSDCTPASPTATITAIETPDIGSAGTFSKVTTSADHPFIEGDILTITNTTNYNGLGQISQVHEDWFEINMAFVSPESSGDVTYSSPACGVQTSRVNTNSGLTLSELSPQKVANLASALFYIDDLFPIYAVGRVDNDESTGICAFWFGANTLTGFRGDYFENVSGSLVFGPDGTLPGSRGQNSSFTSPAAWFQAAQVSPTYGEEYRSLSRLAIGFNNDDNRIHLMFTATNGSTGDPEVINATYDSSLAPVGQSVVIQERVLVSGTAVPYGSGTTKLVFCVEETTAGTLFGATEDWKPADHTIYRGEISSSTGGFSKLIELGQNSTLTTDAWLYDGRHYFGVSRAMSPDPVGGSPANFGASQNMVVDLEGNVVAAVATGMGGSCVSTDWAQIRLLGWSLFTGVQRVVVSGSKVTFGSSQFANVVDLGSVFTLISRFSGVMSETAVPIYNASIAEIDFAPKRYLPSVEAAGSMLLGGGLLWEYGGDKFKENGFLLYPQLHDKTVGAFAGGIEDGTYRYRAIFEWAGKSGAVQRSYPSDYFSVGVADDKEVSFKVDTPQWTQKREHLGLPEPRIVLYRTTGKGGTPGTIYYRCGSFDVDFSEPYRTVTDTLQDAVIQNNEPLYSSGEPGDIYGNLAPPSQHDIAVHRNRVYLACVDGSVWYSKRFSPRIAVEFSELQQKAVDNYNGKVTTLVPNRESLLIMTEQDVYYLAGDGPSSAGQGPDFVGPTMLARGQGAALGAVRAATSMGAIYHSKRGIFIITADMQTKYIGAPVEDSIAEREPVAVVSSEKFNEIYIPCKEFDDSSSMLVYNSYFDQWAQWDLPVSGSGRWGSVVGGMLFNDQLHLVHDSGFVTVQDDRTAAAPSFRDVWDTDNSQVSLRLTTPWINPSMFLSMGRFWRLLISGEHKSDHDLTVLVYSDFDMTNPQSQTVAVTAANGNQSPYRFRIHIKDQKARALRFLVADASSVGTYESMTLDGFALEYGQRPGALKSKMGPSRTIGAI